MRLVWHAQWKLPGFGVIISHFLENYEGFMYVWLQALAMG